MHSFRGNYIPMTFRALQMRIIHGGRYMLFISLMLTAVFITFGAPGKSFTALRSYFATTSPFPSASFMSDNNTSHYVTHSRNDMITVAAKLLPLTPEAQTSFFTTEIHKSTPKECDTNVTLVSAFFNIGDHKKGGGKRNITEYFEWSKAFGFIWNTLYFYTDSPMFAEHLTKIRSSLNGGLTHIFFINRSSLWSFKLRDAIARLYQDKSYPKHHPNTVVPEYSCSMHSKYACMQNAIMNTSEGMTTTYYAWIDIGYFRSLRDKTNYCIILPTGYNSDKVMFNQVYNPNFDLTPKQIYYGNHVWVGGGMFLAARDTMLRFCSEYRRAVEFYLFSRNLSSTDQQCLYSSYTKSGRKDVNMTVELQTFQGNGDWFKLGTSSLRRLNLLQH